MTAVAPERHLTPVPAPRPQVVVLSEVRQAAAQIHDTLGVTPSPVDAFTGDAALAFMILHLQAAGCTVVLDDLTSDEAVVLAEMRQRIGVSTPAYLQGVG